MVLLSDKILILNVSMAISLIVLRMVFQAEKRAGHANRYQAAKPQAQGKALQDE